MQKLYNASEREILATRLTLPKANTRQTNHFIQCEYFMRQITTFRKTFVRRV